MQAGPKILVVEDDLELREQLVQRLSHGFRPIPANDAEALFSCLREEHPVDAILLDVLLPGVDGLSVCKKIRSGQEHCPSNIPIIMLSALSDPTDRVAGLHAGADDYIAKPFFTAELIARINAVLRRSSGTRADALEAQDNIRFGEWKLNRKTRQLMGKEGLVVMLTQGDYKLLSCFLAQPGTVFTREQIAELFGTGGQDLNNVNVRVRRLREKLGDSKDHPYIQSIRSEGYAWVMPVMKDEYA